ncbi:MAG: hypothetical protein J6K32_06695 [Clostridia bacterium]|nr:hypothetical protein [Clostridia bacterium]
MKKYALMLLLLALFCAPLCAWAQTDSASALGLNALVPAAMPAQEDSAMIPLYCGPTQGFYRHGEQALDLTQPYVLFGQHDCWAMAAQGTPDAFGPVGWVEAASLPIAADAPSLAFEEALVAMIEEDAPLTNDPHGLCPQDAWSVTLPRGAQVILLAAMGDWVYIQADLSGTPVRAFIPAACVL